MKNSGLRAVIVLILLNISVLIGRAQDLIPPFPIDPFYDSWSFYDPTNWLSDEGYAPNTYTNIVDDESAWSSDDGILNCNGLILDSTNAAFLNYKTVESNGHTNLSCTAGTIWFWFSPDWDSQNQGGTGPGDWGRFIDVGAYTTNATFGWWSLFTSPDGNNIYFSGQTNGATTNYLNASISWTTGSWHLIGLTYTPTNSILYIDDQVATNGLGVIYPPGHSAYTNGFWIGSGYSGIEQARGEFVDLESWLIQFSSNEFSAYYDEMAPEFGGGGFHTDSFSPPDFSSGGGGSSYFPDLYGTNLWLYIAGIQTNTVGLFLINTEPDISYEIQSKTDLTLTNWNSEGFVLGSEFTNWTEMDIAQGNRITNLFFRIRSAQSSDASGLPDWWEFQYFGTNGIDPNADPEGDGWSNIQKFQNGMNPNVFYTPPAPQGLTVSFNSSSGVASVSWLPSPGNVTGYTVTRGDYDLGGTTSFTVSSNAFSISDTITDSPDFNLDYVFGITGPEIDIAYQVQANYGSSGDSSLSDPVLLEPSYYFQSGVYYGTGSLPVSLVAGSQGTAYIAAFALPAKTAFVRVSRVDNHAHLYYSVDSLDTNFDIPVSAFTNGFYLLPSALTAPAADSYGANDYSWYAELVDASNNPSESQELTYNGNSYTDTGGSGQEWMVSPYYDGRAQLKQNLIFLLRSPDADAPFQFGDTRLENGTEYNTPVNTSSNYVYADFTDANGLFPWYANDGVFAPFANNYLYQNFVFSAANVNSGGALTTGVSYDYYNNFYYVFGYYALTLQEPASYQFQPPANGSTISPLLATNGLYAPPLATLKFYGLANRVGLNASTNSPPIWTLNSGAKNYWGLPYLSAKLTYGSGSSYTLSSGGSFQMSDANVYVQTAQPGFQLVEYDFNMASSPGSTNFSTTNTSNPAIITSVGNPNFSVSGYAKLAVTNSAYSGVYGYLGQYFDKAYQIDTKGVVTTNTTGVLSSYGNFFATQPGAAALVTMPDLDTGARGTGIVYAVSLQLDANHDGNMDLTFNGADATSSAKPMKFWANNNYDRSDYDADDDTNYLDDVQIAGCPYTTNTATVDCEYRDAYGNRVIPNTRDLEDYARLWVCGITTNLLAALPAGSTVTLNWGDVGSPNWNGNNPTIDLFQAVDSDGGIGYLTNETEAAEQIDPVHSSYVGRLAPGGSVQLNSSFFSGWAGNHLIWCGVTNGSGQLNLTIADASGNVLAQASQWIQIADIKQMYERWTVGENLTNAPKTTASLGTEGLAPFASAFQYTLPQDTNTSYILFVHGWNMETWEKDRFAETAFKRLYWQGYQGRFGAFRWPTGNGFTGNFGQLLTNPQEKDNFDDSEYNAWLSGTGLLNKLNDLNAEYPGHVYVLAHSMGNIVTGAALRLAGTNQVINSYVASQAAVTAHTYDETVTGYSFNVTISGITFNLGPKTPNIYGDWFTNNNGGGAAKVISFYNTNDFALSRLHWQLDQLSKPDTLVAEGGSFWNYLYSGSTNDSAPWNNFYKTNYTGATVTFDIVNALTNRYEVMSYAAQSYATALGATPGVHNIAANEDLTTLWPSPDPLANNYASHFFHSAEFRGDSVWEWNYWNTLLFSGTSGFNLASP